ncbi:aminodeoxychorismate lyase [Yokenella regensburgei]|uniref:aminodeoxychorismate lyase n=1 Tax=Yokenella regensburgei TaxID=158877 RepID=UPI003F15073E
MFLINGLEQDVLSARDRAVQFGDGCFTTARVEKGCIHLLNEHLARLQQACDALFITFTDWDVLEQEMRHLATRQGVGVLKVILSRGSGGRGYSARTCLSPSRILSVSPAPAQYARWREEGITLSLSPVRLGRNPLLAGVKHLNRLEQVLIRRYLEQTDRDEALVLDSDGWVTECCAANIFWRKGCEIFTPRVDQAGVNGIMRQHCLQQLASSGYGVNEVNMRADALKSADEVMVCNALMPIVPVRQWDEKVWTSREMYNFLAPLCEHPISS